MKVARWESPSGLLWLELHVNKWGWGYNASHGGGFFGKASEERVAEMVAQRLEELFGDRETILRYDYRS